MSEQIRKTKSAQKRDQSEDQAAEATSETDAGITDDIDAILDEIDEVLETNAADFVHAFVQKGGE